MKKYLIRTFVRHGLALLLVAGVLLATTSLAQACPQCQKALAGSAGGVQGKIVRSYFISIMFMLATPFVVVGSLSTYFYVLIRRARLAAQQASLQPEVATSSASTASPMPLEPQPAGA